MKTHKGGITRREFVRDAGGLVIGFSIIDAAITPQLFAQSTVATAVPPSPKKLESWLHILPDGSVQVFTGKLEIGMGVDTAFTQIVAEELDLSPLRVKFVLGDTATTTDQGGVGGSTSVSLGARPLRNVSAAARAALVQRASQQLGVPVDQLQVKDGVVRAAAGSRAAAAGSTGLQARQVTYGELATAIAAEQDLKVSGAGFALNVESSAKPKDPSKYTVVGTSVPRIDMAPKILGTYKYVVDVRVPGMLHGRVVRPAGVGATLVSVDDSPAKTIPGYVKTVVEKDFVGVVCEHEWAAVKAAKAIKVTWSAPLQAFPEQKDLYNYMRAATPKSTRKAPKTGDVDAALAGAAKKLDAKYDVPFQSHATMGPGCGVADVRPDGITTVWSGGQKPHALQKGYAELLGVPAERVRVVWMQDAGSYGRPGFEDAGADAVLLSKAVGKPVRVQWMRHDMTAWGAKGPACVYDLAGAIDAQGNVTGVRFVSRAFSGGEILYLPDAAGNYLGAQLTGIRNTTGVDEFADWGANAPPYRFPSLDASSHVLAGFHESASPLRSTHLRDPEGPATSFAVECFIDELAAAADIDPIELRLKHIDEPRAKYALRAAADKYGWESRPSPRPNNSGNVVVGRGIALGVRNGTYVGTIAEVEVNRTSGVVKVTRLVCSHDCGLIVNPDALKSTIAANLVQSLGRTTKEEVMFDRSSVTSVDWNSYKVARASDVPASVEIVLIDRKDLPPGGAGEPSSRPTAAAIANAVFDATGVRIRQLPLSPERVKAAVNV
ncbi:MAG TPA: molybdopterin cofactor-binding domain-containing protein [Vicinamibacterales bacterium]|nr:molybdopterin cofactor-binding domain-containing protein [Vicinamibacterales bacterium]